MRLKPDWISYLHDYRQREFQRIFFNVPTKSLGQSLELGAGDGFQSRLLAPLTSHLISTDYSPAVMHNQGGPDLEYRQGDAELVGQSFPAQSFDFVFSSSLLEHVPHPQAALAGIHRVLKNDGLTVHIMPNPFWKASYLLLYYPNLVLTVLEKLINTRERSELIDRELHPQSELEGGYIDNNQKTQTKTVPFLRHLWPQPHGVSRFHWQEFSAFSARRWQAEFERAGFTVQTIIRGPVTSGHGLGWSALRSWLERLGASSVNAVVATKKDSSSSRLHYFLPQL